MRRFAAPALALASRIVLDDRLAEDVVQEVFVAVWRRPGAFDARRGSLSAWAWLMAMVHHKAVDAVRREQSARRRASLDDLLSASRRGGFAADPAEWACERAADSLVRTALLTLPLTQREALVLAYWGGCTQRQIATLTGTPIGTVKFRTLNPVVRRRLLLFVRLLRPSRLSGAGWGRRSVSARVGCRRGGNGRPVVRCRRRRGR